MTQPQPMTSLPFRLDEPMVIKAARLNASRYNMRLFWFVLAVALLTSSYFIQQGGHGTPGRIILQLVLTTAGACLIGGLLIYLLRAIVLPMHVRKNLRQQKALAEEMQLSWADHEFTYTTGKSQTLMPFSQLHGYRASDEMILLYLSDVLYLLVPVSAFGTSGLRETLLSRLAEAGVRRL